MSHALTLQGSFYRAANPRWSMRALIQDIILHTTISAQDNGIYVDWFARIGLNYKEKPRAHTRARWNAQRVRAFS